MDRAIPTSCLWQLSGLDGSIIIAVYVGALPGAGCARRWIGLRLPTIRDSRRRPCGATTRRTRPADFRGHPNRTVAEWETRLAAADVPHCAGARRHCGAGPSHAVAREMVVEAEHPTIGPMRVIGRPIKFPGAPQSPVTARRPSASTPPLCCATSFGYGEARSRPCATRGDRPKK